MKHTQDLLGLKVIEEEKGEELGTIIDIIVDLKKNKLIGLIIKEDEKNYLVPDYQLSSLGEDYIIIKDKKNLVENDYETLTATKDLIGTQVVTNKGKSLGLINDILLTEKGQLDGYELSDGLVQDILEGRNILSAEKEITYGKEKMIIEEPLI